MDVVERARLMQQAVDELGAGPAASLVGSEGRRRRPRWVGRMNAETLRCAACGKEVRVVRLNKTTLTFGHIRNPKNERHMVQLARSESAPASRTGGNPARSKVSDQRRGAETPRRRVDAPSATDPAAIPVANLRGTPRSPARAGRVDASVPRLPAPRSARAG